MSVGRKGQISPFNAASGEFRDSLLHTPIFFFHIICTEEEGTLKRKLAPYLLRTEVSSTQNYTYLIFRGAPISVRLTRVLVRKGWRVWKGLFALSKLSTLTIYLFWLYIGLQGTIRLK